MRKSGIPEFVEIPAPTHRTIRLGLPVLMYLRYQLANRKGGYYSATPSRSDVVRILVMSSSEDREKFTPIKEDFLTGIQL